MNIKTLTIVSLALVLGACSSVPPPPHCEDDGMGLRPINPERLTPETIFAVQSGEMNTDRFDSHGGKRR